MSLRALVSAVAALVLSQAPADPEVAKWEAAVASQPDSAAAHYNLGVARYRAGQFKEAADSFKRAGEVASGPEWSDPALAASSAYNRAASFYGTTREQAAAAQRMLDAKEREPSAEAAGNGIDPEALKQAIADATASFNGFRDAAYADPADLASRANAEQSRRLVRALEELQRQQQQNQERQQQEQQQDQQQDQDQKQDQESQPSEDQRQPQDGERQKPQDSGSQPDQREQPKQDETGTDRPSREDKQRQEQQQQQQPDQKPPADPATDEESAKQRSAKPGEMTKDEADRLLQGVRDRERRRRAEQDRRAQEQATRGRAPVKDW